MLIKDEVLKLIKTGEVTVLFRRWSRPGAKAGGTQMTQGGVVGIDSVEVVTEDEITEQDARDAGYPSRDKLLSGLSYRDDPIYRIRVHWGGEDPRIALRENDDLAETELTEIIDKLAKLDKNSKRGAWTKEYLEVIDSMPNTYSGLLANYLGLEIADFKPWVRKLKALGLTESLHPGYKLSPRGEKVLGVLRQKQNK
ncbi:MAG TPA: hypothetical protein VMS29_06050 [Pyrinomonadaceae bacterium]|nr:hypothetical protein [Pyrinomonadaceae bacterium]